MIVSLVKNSIEDYFKLKGSNKPVRYERVESEVNIDLGAVIRILKKDVSWRFLKLNGSDIPLYSFSENSDRIILRDVDSLRHVCEKCLHIIGKTEFAELVDIAAAGPSGGSVETLLTT